MVLKKNLSNRSPYVTVSALAGAAAWSCSADLKRCVGRLRGCFEQFSDEGDFALNTYLFIMVVAPWYCSDYLDFAYVSDLKV